MRFLERQEELFREKVWGLDLESLKGPRYFLVRALRLVHVTVVEVIESGLTLRAMSLVYTTLLSLVPLLAVSVSVLKAFGVHNKIEPFLVSLLLPLGPQGEEITRRIIEFVNNMKVGVLGSLGLAFLMYTVISLLQKIERAFNSIWRVQNPRSFARRFSDYMSMVLVGPVLVVSAMGLTASVMSSSFMQRLAGIEPFGTLFALGARLLPYVLVCAAFTIVYSFMPNRKVNSVSALVGGITGGVLWVTAEWGFASFIVTSAKYAAIYSGFAILVLFMIWLYLSWIILLTGAVVSFYHQYPQAFVLRKEEGQFRTVLLERTAFLVMFLIAYNFYHGREPWTQDTLVARLALPVKLVNDIIDKLREKKMVMETGEDQAEYLPARDIGTIRLSEVLGSVRYEEEPHWQEGKAAGIDEVDRVMEKMDEAMGRALGEETLRDVVLAHGDSLLPEG